MCVYIYTHTYTFINTHRQIYDILIVDSRICPLKGDYLSLFGRIF